MRQRLHSILPAARPERSKSFQTPLLSLFDDPKKLDLSTDLPLFIKLDCKGEILITHSENSLQLKGPLVWTLTLASRAQSSSTHNHPHRKSIPKSARVIDTLDR